MPTSLVDALLDFRRRGVVCSMEVPRLARTATTWRARCASDNATSVRAFFRIRFRDRSAVESRCQTATPNAAYLTVPHAQWRDVLRLLHCCKLRRTLRSVFLHHVRRGAAKRHEGRPCVTRARTRIPHAPQRARAPTQHSTQRRARADMCVPQFDLVGASRPRSIPRVGPRLVCGTPLYPACTRATAMAGNGHAAIFN